MPTDGGGPPGVAVLFAGLPETGKTTYLALLYLAVSSGRTTDLRLGSYRDDREYVNRIAKKLQACEEIAHTEVEEQGRLQLSLEVGPAHTPALLTIPDLSGETWQDAVYERTWPQSVEELARAASGILIFVHVTKFDAAPSIASVRAAEVALGEPVVAYGDIPGGSLSGDEAVTRYQPTQVQIVDLLQLLCEERSARPARAGIVLSAWDLTHQTLTPMEWLATNAPLADQYLRANLSWLESAVWGVDAQGGDFRDGAERTALLGQDVVDRALVVDDQGHASAIEAPAMFVMRIDEQ